ncbi:MAG: HAD family hydrolase [Candidatus Anammoxibacter sp.]
MDIDLIIFDLDGTLIDSKLDIVNSVNYMLGELGLNSIDNETIYSYVGNGAGNLVKCSLTEKHYDKFDKAEQLFMEYYTAHVLDNTVLYEGVNDVLDYYRLKKKAIVTNKVETFATHILKSLSIFDRFDMVVCGDTLPKKKPDPDQINAVMSELKIERAKTLMVGDGDADIKAAVNARIHTCGVTYGFGSRPELEKNGTEVIIDHLVDMKKHFT